MTITGRTQVAGVIGSPVRHSLSPAILNTAFEAAGIDAEYFAFEVAPGRGADAVAAMRALQLLGLSVTMPHKQDVAAAVDRCSDDASALEAVNCIAWDGDALVGHNTDGPGFIDALRDASGFDARDRAAVVVGAGGAARAVVLALARAGAASVTVVNRTAARAEAAAALAGDAGRVGDLGAVAAADLVVNATPVGMGEDTDLAVPADLIHHGQVVVDLVYHPIETPLLRAARAQGAAAVDGVGMLVHQAGHAFRLWTGADPPLGAMTAAARGALSG